MQQAAHWGHFLNNTEQSSPRLFEICGLSNRKVKSLALGWEPTIAKREVSVVFFS